MKRWNDPESLFEPIVAAVPPGTVWCGFGAALKCAVNAVPQAELIYNMRRGFKTAQDVRDRSTYMASGDTAKPFTYRAFLRDVSRSGPDNPSLTTLMWEVGVTNVKHGLCAPAVPDDFDTALLVVNRFRLSSSALDGGPQLALLRHLWAANVAAASPDAILFGGQRGWRDDWWPETLAGAST